MTLDAVCRTFVPRTLGNYFSQQLRWRRSNLVDYVGGMSHVWKLNPLIAIHFFSLFGLLIAYPALIMRAIVTERFFPLMLTHVALATLFGVVYGWRVRKLPASDKVGLLAFVPIALVLPVTYALLTPLALFTLDSGSWETRGHAPEDSADAEDERCEVPTAVAEMAEPSPVSRLELPAA
ncbi:MAG TPA: hypothetical protein VFB52_05100, partial [Solirubrobacterales bacterium]|nr:hypothetical protein [Solirubrobacterales bacterium]